VNSTTDSNPRSAQESNNSDSASPALDMQKDDAKSLEDAIK
jgi:hypothetical protein